MMKNRDLTNIFAILLILALCVGYFLNIAKLIEMEGITGFFVVRGIGIVVVPLGSIMGFF